MGHQQGSGQAGESGRRFHPGAFGHNPRSQRAGGDRRQAGKHTVPVISPGETRSHRRLRRVADRTAEIIRTFRERGVRFFELPDRTGKAGALNLGLRQASGEIIVFTDASITLEPESLLNLFSRSDLLSAASPAKISSRVNPAKGSTAATNFSCATSRVASGRW